MEKIVFDTHAIMAFFYAEEGGKIVKELAGDARIKSIPILMCAVNYGEVFYAVQKKDGHAAAIKARELMDRMPVHLVDADRELSLLAASIKAERKMSFADCFSAATAMIHKAPVVTGDKEFKEVENEIEIIWI